MAVSMGCDFLFGRIRITIKMFCENIEGQLPSFSPSVREGLRCLARQLREGKKEPILASLSDTDRVELWGNHFSGTHFCELVCYVMQSTDRHLEPRKQQFYDLLLA